MPVSSRADAPHSGVRARSNPAALREVDDWLEGYRRFWEAGLDRLEAYLGELQAKERQEASSKQRKAAKRKAGRRRAVSKQPMPSKK